MSRMVKKAGAFEIVNHWMLAGSCLVLALSGFAFVFHLDGVAALFGGFPPMRAWHNISGVVFAVSLFLTVFSYLPVSLSFSADDMKWLSMGGGYLSRNKKELPPQDKLNTGQKLYYLVLLGMGAVMSASGFTIWLLGNKGLVLLSYFAHNLFFVFFMVAIPVHIYLGTFANPGTLRIMLSGKVPLDWARRRYGKWVSRMGLG